MAEHHPGPPTPIMSAVAREYVGPEDGREDVTDLSDRALILRSVHEVLCLRYDFGLLLAEMSRVSGRVTALEKRARESRRDIHELAAQEEEREITEVRDLKRLLREQQDQSKWLRRRLIGAAIGIVVIVAGAYVCMKLGLRLP